MSGMYQFEWGHLIYLLILLVVVALFIPRHRLRGGDMLRILAIWLAVAAALALAYGQFEP